MGRWAEKISEKLPKGEPTKPTEAPFVGFVSAKGKAVSENSPPAAEPPPLTPEDEANIREATEERSAIMEFDGGVSRQEAEARAHAAMAVFRYQLTTKPGAWLVLIAPGRTLEDARDELQRRFGDRFLEVKGQAGEISAETESAS